MNVPRGTTSDKADTPGVGDPVYWFHAPEYDVERLKERLDRLPGLFPEKASGTILLKPNLLSPRTPESAVCTHPAFVEAVASLFLDKGYKVAVGDSPSYATLGWTLRKAGYSDFMQRLGIAAAAFSEGVDKKGRFFRKIRIAETVLDADAVINLPKLKTHGVTGLTLAVKNLLGCVPGFLKARWHVSTGQDARLFALALLDIAEVVHPHFSILDGVVGMDERGPAAGRARDVGIVFASRDVLALDLAAASCLGSDAHSVTTLRYAADFYGRPLPSPRVIPIDGEADGAPRPPDDFRLLEPESLSRPYLFPKRLWSLLRRTLAPYPLVLADRCTGCGACVAICPVQTISIAGKAEGPAVIDYGPCIRCFCCEEACPENAITPRVSLLGRLVRWG